MVSTASPSGIFNLVSRVYVGEPYAAAVEQAIDGVLVRKFSTLGYAYQKASPRWTAGQNSVRDGLLEIPYQFSANPNLNSIALQEALTSEIRAAMAAQSPVSYAYVNPAATRLLAPGSNRDITIWAATEAAPTRTYVGEGDVNTSTREGKLDPYHGEKPPLYANPVEQTPSNTGLILAGLGIGGLLLWTLAESRKRGH